MQHDYCYICQQPKPCGPDAVCKTVKGYDRQRLYWAGYRKSFGGRSMKVVQKVAKWKKQRHEEVIRERRTRRRIDLDAGKFRREAFRRIEKEWVAADLKFQAERELREKQERQAAKAASVAYFQGIKEARRQAEEVRRQKARDHYWECLEILAEYEGPGTRGQYSSPEEAQAARKRYKAARAIVDRKTPAGRANERAQDAKRRLQTKGIRQGKTNGVGEFYREMYSADKVACFYCDKPLSIDERRADHFIPLAKGGPHAASNLVMACPTCNSDKSDTLPSVFLDKIWNSNQ